MVHAILELLKLQRTVVQSRGQAKSVFDQVLLARAVAELDGREQYDRLIVITDEQSHDKVPAPKGRGYVINVASFKNGVGYGAWTHIDGWSESVVEYIRALEQVPED